ncbi:hypothetical protein B0H16DRAFT_1781204 [Mycena metata]|uniref:Uncharacterized protein n=1 Tax=Mycena metata TaxID=1033252 RepID=A0AAD7NNX0_9AGAR|nr:hypothetical protein B0H16DRAFT_1781204 [Mycena metata]
MLIKKLLTLALFTASAAALGDPTLAREYPRSANEGTAVAPNNCTAVHHISELKSLSGWHALTKYLNESQLMSPSIGKGNSGVTTVAACVGRGPFAVKAGTVTSTGAEFRPIPSYVYAPGVVHLGYTAGFSTRVTMTTRKSAIFSAGISASVDLALPAFGIGSVGMLTHALVPNSVGSKYTLLLPASPRNLTDSVHVISPPSPLPRMSLPRSPYTPTQIPPVPSEYVLNFIHPCAVFLLPPNHEFSECGQYHISSCSAPATAKFPSS